MAKPPAERKRRHRIGGATLAAYIGLVRRTSRVVSDPPDVEARLRELHPFICTVWHGQFMMVPSINTGRLPTQIMLARHGDAEVMADAVERFHMQLVRGAGAAQRRRDKGGAAALRAALKALGEGNSFAMTADVPPGPARKAGLGIVALARMSGRPILPVAIATRRSHTFNTWSRLTLNLPFSTLGIALGEPIIVPRDIGTDEIEHYRQQIETALNATTAKAYALAGADPRRAAPYANMRTTAGDIGLRLKGYRAVTAAAAPLSGALLGWRERQGKEDPARRGERQGIASMPRPAGQLAWLHAASVGETIAILPVIGALLARRPGLAILLTTGTRTSAGLAAERLPAGAVHQYLPLDIPAFMARFLDHWRPDLAVLTESEIWPNLILEASDRRIPLALVNARMSARSFARWRKRPALALPLFGRFDLVLTQSEKLARRFNTVGVVHATPAGNLKIDAPPPPIDAAALAILEGALGGRPQYVAASTHDGEDQIIAAAHRAMARDIEGLMTVIAPRHPERGPAIAAMLASQGLSVARRALGQLPERGLDVYIADTIGELGTLYALSPVAFVGGSLVPHGGQNPIEAVRHGAAVITGPHWHNFNDAYGALLRHKGAIEVRDAEGIAQTVASLLRDGDERARMRQRANNALAGMSGALERTIEALVQLLATPKGSGRAAT